MLRAAWPDVAGNLASTRKSAAVFLDNLEGRYGSAVREAWVARWTRIGDAHCLLGDLRIEEHAIDVATEAWLCALTAYEVARRLTDQDDPRNREVSAKLEWSIQRFGFSFKQKVERVQIGCSGQPQVMAYYLPPTRAELCYPAVICISREDETAAMLLGRLLPVVIGRGLSVLVVSHENVSGPSAGQSEILSCCLDYLSMRSEVDGARIGIYGDGFSACLATDFVASSHRVAAAVCDGGVWKLARTLASVSWMTGTREIADENVVSAYRLRFVRQLRCPVLIVAGGRGIVSVSEANRLQAECAAEHIDLKLAVPRTLQTPVGEIENFVVSDDCIFAWLEHKLAPPQGYERS